MTRSSATILDQIARFFILLTDEGWFSLHKSCDNALYISKRVGIDECNYQALLIAGHLAMLKGARGEFRHGPVVPFCHQDKKYYSSFPEDDGAPIVHCDYRPSPEEAIDSCSSLYNNKPSSRGGGGVMRAPHLLSG
jgi:hypothetical protein